ncbi:MAG: prepilin peptidase [Deltaproteobacteria bacterium]|nr:prepilin peptidase [Deltaproteobacteria bacterium]
MLFGTFVPLPCVILAVVAAAIGAYTDFRRGHIPNWLTFGALGLGVVLQAAFSESHAQGALAALLGAFLCAIFPWVLFKRDAMGGGDVKLFAALGALLGAYHGIEAQFLACCAATVFALARLAWYGRLLSVMSNALFLGLNPLLPRRWKRDIAPDLLTKIRFGGGILAGTAIAALYTLPFSYL